MEAIIGEVFLATIEGDRDKLSAFSNEEMIDGCVSMARYIVRLQLAIASRGQEKETDESAARKDDSQVINSLRETNEELKDEISYLKECIEIHRKTAVDLKQELENMPKAGRPDIYDSDFRAKVKAYYKNGHTYRDTAKHFNISTNTVGRFVK